MAEGAYLPCAPLDYPVCCILHLRFFKKYLFFIALTPFAAVGIYAGLRNKMMIYIEEKLYDHEVPPKSQTML